MFQQLLKKIKQWRCPHYSESFFRNIYGDEIIHSGGCRSVWTCDDCGAYLYKRLPFKDHQRGPGERRIQPGELVTRTVQSDEPQSDGAQSDDAVEEKVAPRSALDSRTHAILTAYFQCCEELARTVCRVWNVRPEHLQFVEYSPFQHAIVPCGVEPPARWDDAVLQWPVASAQAEERNGGSKWTMMALAPRRPLDLSPKRCAGKYGISEIENLLPLIAQGVAESVVLDGDLLPPEQEQRYEQLRILSKYSPLSVEQFNEFYELSTARDRIITERVQGLLRLTGEVRTQWEPSSLFSRG